MKNKKILSYSLVLVLLFVYFICMFFIPFYEGGVHLLRATLLQWQTFNAGMVALIAAVITAAVAIKSDKAAWERHYDAIERELKATRLLLNLPLRSIIEYVNYCMDEILNYYVVIDKCDKEKKEKSKEIMIRNIEQMEKPKDHEEIFTDFIKLSSGREEKVERILTGILYEINIFMSRLHLMKRIEENRFIQEKTSLKHTIAMGLIVKQMASDLLPYANTYVNNSRSVRETFTDKKIYKTLISTHIENKNINIDGDFPSDIETMAERLFRDLHRG